ncbi:MAG: hypothetical protein IJ829_02800, partial [Kiritimatiellae bacterium]|nr:hypothetical protein [Kiritimatiellia bacterium]
NGARAVRRDGGLELAVSSETASWCNMHLVPIAELPVALFAPGDELVFEANAGRTPFGRRGAGRNRIRLDVVFKMADGKEKQVWVAEKDRKTAGGVIDDDGWTWQEVRWPFAAAFPEGAVAVKRLTLQLCNMRVDGRCGLVVRNLRVAPAAPRPPPPAIPK